MPQRKKPVSAHVANGTYRPSVHGPRPEQVAPAPASAPKKPKGLDKDAARAWKELVGLVAARLRIEDGPQLEQLAAWLARWRQIEAALVDQAPGTTTYSRLLAALSTASQNFDRIARKYGLTPLDRESLAAPAAANGPKRW